MEMILVGLVVGLLAGGGAVAAYDRMRAKKGVAASEAEADRIVRDAKVEAETLKRQADLDAQATKLAAKEAAEKEARAGRAELERAQERLEKREETNERKAELVANQELELAKRAKSVDERDRNVAKKEEEVSRLVAEAEAQVERAAGMTADQARKTLVDRFVDEAKHTAAKQARLIEDEAKEEAEKRAKRIVGIAIQRYAGEYVQERAVTAVELPSDDMKGRIIGREGRNIRALEAACGVDLIIDDTPETVVISSFDPIRREIGRVALERLIADGRIHPTRIEDIVGKAKDEVEKAIREAGEQAVLELGLSRIHGELVRTLGSLKYRYSYAQNVLRHSVETGYIAGMMAAELKLNVKQARRAGLLHDLGKAVTHEVEGSHALIGAQMAKKYGESPAIVSAIASHHEDEPPDSVLAHLVAAADALSGARPGARREMLETYVRRLEELERICGSFSGVDKSYAIQAGREVRVLVESERISDTDARLLSKEIAKKIEDELTYPGQIRVTVIRETRAVEYAK